jgi:transposase
MKALETHPPQGMTPRLSAEQKEQIPELLAKGAEAYGYRGDVWTASRVAEVIAKTFGVRYHRDHVGRLLREAGWSRQKPVERASQRNEEALKNWSDERWPDIKKKPKKKRPPSSGQTPLLRVKLTRDHRIVRSVASLWMDACSCKCGLPRITRKPWLVSCASSYARCAGKIVLIWDGSPIHRAHEIKDFLKRGAA